jgi:hypothetical protein
MSFFGWFDVILVVLMILVLLSGSNLRIEFLNPREAKEKADREKKETAGEG